MLRPTLLAVAISCALACAAYGQQSPAPQTAPPAAQTPATEAKTTPPASNVPMSEPVLTLKGACPPKNGSVPKGCVNSLTREQFEKLTNALQPADKGPVPPDVRRRFATQYAKLLSLADAARELGLENDPKVQEIFNFAKNQILAESLNQHYMEKFSHPTDQQIQEYYDKNQKKYKEATLERIIIPMAQNSPDKEKQKPTEEEQKAYADSIRSQWAAGGDPAKLEKEVMEHNGMSNSAPDVNVGARRPGSLPEAHEPVFDMKQGDVSPVYSDPAAFYIYKVVSVRQVPLSEVKAQISQTLQREMFTTKMQEMQTAVTPVLNDAYFGPEPAPNAGPGPMHPGMMPGHPGPPPPPGAPAAQNSGASPK